MDYVAFPLERLPLFALFSGPATYRSAIGESPFDDQEDARRAPPHSH